MEEKTNEKSATNKFRIFYILLLIISTIISFFVGKSIKNSNEDSSNTNSPTYSIKYTSIDFDEDSTYVNFDVKSNGMTIYAGDFSVKIDDLPIQADYIYNGFWEGSLHIDSQTIRIKFKKKKSELDTPITFYYKGTILELGKSVDFQY